MTSYAAQVDRAETRTVSLDYLQALEGIAHTAGTIDLEAWPEGEHFCMTGGVRRELQNDMRLYYAALKRKRDTRRAEETASVQQIRLLAQEVL